MISAIDYLGCANYKFLDGLEVGFLEGVDAVWDNAIPVQNEKFRVLNLGVHLV